MSASKNSLDPVQILCLDGDGIGPEITAATRRVLQAVDDRFDLNLTFTTPDMGFMSVAASGTTFPDKVLDAAKAADGIVMGPVSTVDYPPASEGGINPSGFLRKQLDLYANIRPAKSYEGLPPRVGDKVDLVIARENTEGFYSDR